MSKKQAPHFFLNPYPFFFQLLMMGYMMLRKIMLMWLVIGGLIGCAIAYICKEKPKKEFYLAVITGVAFIIFSAFTVMSVAIHHQYAMLGTLLLACLCGIGALILDNRNKITMRKEVNK